MIGDELRAHTDERRATEGGGRRPRAQSHAGFGTPELRPRRLTSGGVGISAPVPLIPAPRWMAYEHIMCFMGGMAEQDTSVDKVRVPLLLSSEEAKELDDWQFQHRHRTRTAALKALMRLG